MIIGLVNSFQRFGKPAEKTELHGSAAMQYAMLHRMLETELSLSPTHRRSDLIPAVRQEMDRLLTQSPPIPQTIIEAYNKEFPNVQCKPDVCGALSVKSPEVSMTVLGGNNTLSRFSSLVGRIRGVSTEGH